MRLRLSGLTERLRASLFFVPMLGVIIAIAAGLIGLAIDRRLDQSRELPLGLTSTVDSARVVLSTIAGATITFAGVAFSVSLLIIQLASSQYSPRVVHTLFRDPFNRRVMGLAVGTFTYCVIVLRSIRSPFEQGGQPNPDNRDRSSTRQPPNPVSRSASTAVAGCSRSTSTRCCTACPPARSCGSRPTQAATPSGMSDRSGALVEQARLIAKGVSMSSELLAEDIESVQAAYTERFSAERRERTVGAAREGQQ